MYDHPQKKTITGVYGGSFNPVHIGHTAMASGILRLGMVDEMWLVVSPQNPLKDSGLWNDEFRLSLARLAVAGYKGMEVCDVEFGLPRPNYMIDTLETLSCRYPDREFVLVIGQDNWECFRRWFRWEDILRSYRLLVLPRQTAGSRHNDGEAAPDGVGRVIHLDIPLVNISSTWIRAQITSNPAYAGEGLAPEVWRSIRENVIGKQ